jgi:hypothetical protein
MVRLCERPGCSQPAELNYGIEAARLTVWIEPFDPARPDRPGVLCRRHADSMVVPLRWTLDDRREAVPRLFRSPAVDPAPRLRPERVTRPRVGSTQLVLDAEPDADADADADVAAIAEVVAQPADATGSPWRPVFDTDDDLDGLLDATGPLLARAFSGRERHRAPS